MFWTRWLNLHLFYLRTFFWKNFNLVPFPSTHPICSCLMVIKKGIVCRHYFQIMLNTSEARFHIRLIPSRWYQRDKDVSYEPFIVADKFHSMSTTNASFTGGYIYAINKEKMDLSEHWMNVLDEKIMYGTLHGIYKKALKKALQTKLKSLRLGRFCQWIWTWIWS